MCPFQSYWKMQHFLLLKQLLYTHQNMSLFVCVLGCDKMLHEVYTVLAVFAIIKQQQTWLWWE